MTVGRVETVIDFDPKRAHYQNADTPVQNGRAFKSTLLTRTIRVPVALAGKTMSGEWNLGTWRSCTLFRAAIEQMP